MNARMKIKTMPALTESANTGFRPPTDDIITITA
jgi:hypothetical protein